MYNARHVYEANNRDNHVLVLLHAVSEYVSSRAGGVLRKISTKTRMRRKDPRQLKKERA